MRDYASRLAALVSQTINCVLLGGHHDQTVSARAYVSRHDPRWARDYRFLNWVFRQVFGSEDHCRASHERDLRWAKEILNLEKSMR